MRRLSLLLLALLLASLGAGIVSGAETYAPYLLRDALLLGAVGCALFAFNAEGWLPPPVLRRPRGLHRAGWTLLLTGLAVTLGGGLGLAVTETGGLAVTEADGLGGVLRLAAALAWGLGIVLQLAGAWWPGVASDYAPPLTRWGRDAAGNIVALDGNSGAASARRRSSPAAPGGLGVRYAPLWLLAVLLLAALLRFWDLAGLPPACIGQECAVALQLQQDAAPSASETGPNEAGRDETGAGAAGASEPGGAAPAGLALQLRLAVPLARGMQDALLGLRLAGALLGLLTVLFTALALRRLVAPLPALLGAALLAISPWHLWAGRTADPTLAATCLLALALWLGLEALERGHARWWLPFGLAAGLLAAQTPPLAPSAALWVLGAAGLGLAQAQAGRGRVGAADRWRWPLCALAAAAGAALGACLGAAPPDWLAWIAPAAATGGVTGSAGSAANSAALLGSLLRPDTLAAGAAAPLGGGLLGGFGFALAVGGLGVLLRHLRQPAAAFVLLAGAAFLGAALLAAAAGLAGSTAVAPSLLPLLPILIALMALALDRLLGALAATWGPPLLRTAVVLGGAALVVLLLAGRGTVALLAGLDSVRGGAGATAEAGMARYIAAQLAAPEGQNVTFVAPPSALDDPSLRLLAGAALEAGRVTGLELGRTLPYAQAPAGDVVYLLPLLDTQLVDLLQRLYPGGTAEIELDAAGTAALFQRFRVRQADLLRAQALEMIVTPADAGADAPPAAAPGTGMTGVTEYVSALDFAWGSAPPLPPPFRAQWSGLLIAPEGGNYTFAVENAAPESTFILTVDDILLLDSSLGLAVQQMPLPSGIHRLHIDYRSGGKPGDLRVTWQAPGPAGEAGGTQTGAQVVAAPLLLSPTIPDQGLLGDYYGNERFEGLPVAEHKDPVIGLDPSLPLPYSVLWHGLLAAPRAGDYLIGVDAPGAAQVTVNGVLLADNRAPAAPQFDLAAEAASSYSEGLIYLPAGWQRIEVRYVAGAGPPAAGAPERLRLLWQPPGGDPSELASTYLLPAYGLVGPADVPLPTLPPVTDPLLGDDRFALARPATAWPASVRVPPASLPPLALERVAQVGGVCGDAADQLNAPHGAAFAADGSRLYVADTGNRRIGVFDAAGLPLESIASDLFQEPVAVALAPNGDLLVLDALAQQILRVAGATAGGEVTALPLQASFYRPRGLAVDAAGNLAVADTGGGRVLVLSPDGAPQREYGGQGSPLSRGQPVDVLASGLLLPAASGLSGQAGGQPDSPLALGDALGAAPALWAISAEDGRLWRLPVDGSLTAVQPSGTVDGPRLAQLSDGRLLASDPARASFTLFSPAGEPLSQFGYTGELQLPTGLAATPGPEGETIAVVDTRACAVTWWRMGGVSG